MHELPEALRPMAAYDQFILWRTAERKGKIVKLPIDPHTLQTTDAHNPAVWVSSAQALAIVGLVGGEYGIGFVFTDQDPFFFLDIDDCLLPGGTWSPLALSLLAALPGAAVEVSISGRSLHVFGMSRPLEHARKNTNLKIELYTTQRFVALTGDRAVGSAALDFSQSLESLVQAYFPPKIQTIDLHWTDEPVPEWAGTDDDEELIQKALASKSAASVFGTRVNFRQLWENDVDALSEAFADINRAYDASSADASLAQHLAFWTGNNCERMLTLMLQSALVREKWNREDYLTRTIMHAVSLQKTFYNFGPVRDTIGEEHGAAPMKNGSPKQKAYAENIRAAKFIECAGSEELINGLCSLDDAKFWIDNREDPPADLIRKTTPITALSVSSIEPVTVSGYQLLTGSLQMEYFAGCCYIIDAHRIFTPSGALLKTDQFNSTYGGYEFQLDENGKTTRKAWDVFTMSQIVRYPKAESECFRPELPTGQIIIEEGRALVNTYVPVDTPRQQGDATPFLRHLAVVLPEEHDRSILLAYMAACVQYKGVKFQWAPLLQGTEGNGKTMFTRCVAFAIGSRYTHFPRASELGEKFNEWLFSKIFIGIEDVHVPEHKKEILEILKPMITNDRLAMRAMQRSQVMGDNRANFMLNSNHRNAIQTTSNDRRFAVFYTAQQSVEDLARYGLGGDYFPDLYDWLRDGGYAIVADFLDRYVIPDALNPATKCHRAPRTTTTHEAVAASLGAVEQEILEAIAENRPGFANGWVSSMSLDRLLKSIRAERAIPMNRRREVMRSLGYDYHPALRGGRVNNQVRPDHGRPRLYVKLDHVARSITSPGMVEREYQNAQAGVIVIVDAGASVQHQP